MKSSFPDFGITSRIDFPEKIPSPYHRVVEKVINEKQLARLRNHKQDRFPGKISSKNLTATPSPAPSSKLPNRVNQLPKPTHSQKLDAELILVSISPDGLSSNLEEWRSFTKYWEGERKLRFFVLYGEEESQWRSAEVVFSEHIGEGSSSGRYWLLCKLKELLENGEEGPIGVYHDVLKQWVWCGEGRDVMKEVKAV